MRRVKLPGTDIPVSRLAFGTASLHYLWSSRDRQNLLAAAMDMDVSHFDTAPYYGFGIAEQEIGRFQPSRKAAVTVATKFGLYPPMEGGGATASVWARKLAGWAIPGLSKPIVDWSVRRAAESLERSLRVLGMHRVDFLLLHDPYVPFLSCEEILSWLSREQKQGKIRAWGLAGELDNMRDMVASGHPLAQVLQVRDSLERREADLLVRYKRPFQFSFGYLGSGRTMPACNLLRAALERNATGAIIVSSRHRHRLAELVAIAEAEA